MKEIILSQVSCKEINGAIKKNEIQIRSFLPETWTHSANLNLPLIGFNLKLLGFNWRSEDEFGKFMAQLHRLNILQADGFLVRRSSHPLYQKE